jgi:hypothetical protein
VVHFQTALGEQLFDVAERQRVPKIPAHSTQNQFRGACRHLKIAGRVASFTVSGYQPPPPELQHIRVAGVNSGLQVNRESSPFNSNGGASGNTRAVVATLSGARVILHKPQVTRRLQLQAPRNILGLGRIAQFVAKAGSI